MLCGTAFGGQTFGHRGIASDNDQPLHPNENVDPGYTVTLSKAVFRIKTRSKLIKFV